MWEPKKGFGFIGNGNRKDIFVEGWDIVNSETPKPGTSVEFEIEATAKGLRARPITLQILSWEMIDRNELTAFLEEVREQQGLKLTAQMAEVHPIAEEFDLLALVTLFSSSINYLAARSLKIRWFNGVDLQDDEGWERLETMINGIIDQLIQ